MAFTDVPADVVPGEVAHGQRPHRPAEGVGRPVHLLGKGAAFHEELGLPDVLVKHPVAHEPVAVANQHAHLPDGARQGHGARDDLGRRLRAPDDLQQPHDVGRAEEMGPDHLLGPSGGGSNGIDVERRRVGREYRPFPHHLVKRRENLLLDRHVLEHRLDHDVRFGERIHVADALNQFHARVERRLWHPAPVHGTLVVAAHDAEPAL